jgi:hypothetical protein
VPRLPIVDPLLDNFGHFDPVNLVNPYSFSVAITPAWFDAIAPGSTDSGNTLLANSQAQPVVAGQSGSCTKLRLWVEFSNISTTDLKMALYDSSFNLLSSGSVTDVGSGDNRWIETTITPQAVSNGATYWIGMMINVSSGIIGRLLASQPSGSSRIEFGTTYAGFPPDPFPTGDWDKTICVGMYIE